MEEFNEYYSNPAIIKMLCKHRAKISHKRHKKHMIRDISLHHRTNNISIPDSNIEFIRIQSFFPTRRNWKKLNQNERLHPDKYNNSLEKNEMRLWKSYKYEKYLVDFHNKIPEKWYLNLIKFCEDIRANVKKVLTNEYVLSKPEIFPLLKSSNNNENLYRPIAKYTLEDKIITSLFSKYLTIKFDTIFSDSSFAFRARRNGKIPNHHDSIIEILKYRKKYRKIWVSECDIQKFYDCVQHKHLISIFNETIIELNQKGTEISPIAIKLFSIFLDSYSFNKDVLPKNHEPTYFSLHGVSPGKFGWVEDELIKKYSKDYIQVHKIGVPQGNAVSCFIANLILNRVDQLVKKVESEILYVRYCDDMILAHPRKDVCQKALSIYNKGIDDNFLLYHKPKALINYKESSEIFWKSKSKKPYFLGNKHLSENNVPWLSFVGYQINYKGEIRIRKSSIQKEVKKQIAETQRILNSIGLDRNRNLENINDFSRKSKGQIIFSLQQRLISMSVGRVTVHNYKNYSKNDLCWTNGFNLIRKNKITINQFKYLDRRREQQIAYLSKMINKLEKDSDEIDDLPKYMKDLYYGLPYSYYNYVK